VKPLNADIIVIVSVNKKRACKPDLGCRLYFYIIGKEFLERVTS
jgi:hypothetical protein